MLSLDVGAGWEARHPLICTYLYPFEMQETNMPDIMKDENWPTA